VPHAREGVRALLGPGGRVIDGRAARSRFAVARWRGGKQFLDPLVADGFEALAELRDAFELPRRA
jgi:hypothetical protein